MEISDGSVNAVFILPSETLSEEDTAESKVDETYDRYGMENDDWHHLDDYWRAMYGDVYPREREWKRGGRLTDADLEAREYNSRSGNQVKILKREWRERSTDRQKRAA